MMMKAREIEGQGKRLKYRARGCLDEDSTQGKFMINVIAGSTTTHLIPVC